MLRRSPELVRTDCERLTCGLGVLVDDAAEDVGEEGWDEKGEKTEPSTRFALSREASLFNWDLVREGFLGSGGDDGGRKSNGTKPAGRRVICIE